MSKYEIGRILEFNKEKWGLVSFSKGKLVVFSIKDKRKAKFTLQTPIFDKVYNSSLPGNVSDETLSFIKKEKEDKDAFLKKVKSGVKFTGTDNKEYTFLSFRGKKVVFFDNTNSYSAPAEFIKSLTGEFNADYMNYLAPVETKKEYNALSNAEKVKVATNHLKNSYNFEDTEFEILEIGNIIQGEAFYHEVDKYYDLIGLQIKFKSRFGLKSDFTTQVGFFPIYTGKLPDYYPISFEESYGNLDFNENSYTNGCGDFLEDYEILIKKEALKDIL